MIWDGGRAVDAGRRRRPRTSAGTTCRSGDTPLESPPRRCSLRSDPVLLGFLRLAIGFALFLAASALFLALATGLLANPLALGIPLGADALTLRVALGLDARLLGFALGALRLALCLALGLEPSLLRLARLALRFALLLLLRQLALPLFGALGSDPLFFALLFLELPASRRLLLRLEPLFFALCLLERASFEPRLLELRRLPIALRQLLGLLFFLLEALGLGGLLASEPLPFLLLLACQLRSGFLARGLRQLSFAIGLLALLVSERLLL